ncbi:MAG: hypothetical protein Q7J43_17280 [Pseudomonas sp.]|uniref:hypothetical protein n=1 Tax=Pseudomonas sp. TaxID=306 RepID=UPI00271DE662|nr:hypothetical protein [Pseudomonas sp.]MDO9619422.1 hypothetical protein [Pseudomonas sp.]MDP2447371.1 hypothetical protein [Pseudomonas sp.]MDZ4298848.1 hypothetical protein [Moraxellaceae bacterium]
MEKFWLILSTTPSGAWVGLLGVIFGSLLTTLGVWLTNSSNRKQLKLQLEHEKRLQSQQLAKDRLEELYILVCHWQNGMFSNYLNLTLVMQGHTDYNQYLDTLISEKPSNRIDFSRLEMIIGIYGEQVQAAYGVTLKMREHINAIEAEYKSAYRRGESGDIFLKPFSDAQLEFGAACDALKDEIALAAREA